MFVHDLSRVIDRSPRYDLICTCSCRDEKTAPDGAAKAASAAKAPPTPASKGAAAKKASPTQGAEGVAGEGGGPQGQARTWVKDGGDPLDAIKWRQPRPDPTDSIPFAAKVNSGHLFMGYEQQRVGTPCHRPGPRLLPWRRRLMSIRRWQHTLPCQCRIPIFCLCHSCVGKSFAGHGLGRGRAKCCLTMAIANAVIL